MGRELQAGGSGSRGFKGLGKKPIEAATGMGGGWHPSACSHHVSRSAPCSPQEKNKKVREKNDTSSKQRTIHYQAEEQKRVKQGTSGDCEVTGEAECHSGCNTSEQNKLVCEMLSDWGDLLF